MAKPRAEDELTGWKCVDCQYTFWWLVVPPVFPTPWIIYRWIWRVATDAYHKKRQRRAEREAVAALRRITEEPFPVKYLTGQSGLNAQGYDMASAMEAAIPRERDEEERLYHAQNAYPIDRLARPTIHPPPRVSSNQNSPSYVGSATPPTERVRGPRNQPSTTQQRTTKNQDPPADQSLASSTRTRDYPLSTPPQQKAPGNEELATDPRATANTRPQDHRSPPISQHSAPKSRERPANQNEGSVSRPNDYTSSTFRPKAARSQEIPASRDTFPDKPSQDYEFTHPSQEMATSSQKTAADHDLVSGVRDIQDPRKPVTSRPKKATVREATEDPQLAAMFRPAEDRPLNTYAEEDIAVDTTDPLHKRYLEGDDTMYSELPTDGGTALPHSDANAVRRIPSQGVSHETSMTKESITDSAKRPKHVPMAKTSAPKPSPEQPVLRAEQSIGNEPRASAVASPNRAAIARGVPQGQSTHESRSQHATFQRPSTAQTPPMPGSKNPRESRPQAEPTSERTSHNIGRSHQSEMTGEADEVLNRVVISDPEVDIKREEERYDEVKGAVHGAEISNPIPSRRQDFSTTGSKRKEYRIGDYILGKTLGEGEFGKVKVGYRQGSDVEVAIKLIRRENLNTNPTRLPKIYREVNILRSLQHPNIVRIHEMLETERYIGIVMECASGGELFDFILKNKFLSDAPAKALFAQLISGVGYLHKKGIVHRDLKLENLLLDKKKNMIITDFGFANTFDPRDELSEEIVQNITDKHFVKKHDLGKIHKSTGFRRGDLMATSCGSPCYAAPELVVTDGLYTGRKVDVWSCGVILFAMLAGFLPFDDDPANPEGDNINLLYKYIVSTKLQFPEYIQAQPKDLLKRMLVPDPRKRADLFEVARHSWLDEYASTITQYTSMHSESRAAPIAPLATERTMVPQLTRSASVREPSKSHTKSPATVGGLSHQANFDSHGGYQKTPRDPKRRTVQVEYVAPSSQTNPGEAPALPDGQRTAQVQPESARIDSSRKTPSRKPLPSDSPLYAQKRQPGTTENAVNYQPPYATDMAPPATRPYRDPPRSISDSASALGQYPVGTAARPNTGGSISSTSAGRLPSRGNSYGQPLAPTVAATTAQARLAQPTQTRTPRYNISAPIPQPEPFIPDEPGRRPTSERIPIRQGPGSSLRPAASPASASGHVANESSKAKSHKRSSTLSNIFAKPASLFGGKPASTDSGKSQKKYPPTSMKSPFTPATAPRTSSESRRTEPLRTSFGFSRKSSEVSRQDKSRRFSLLPASFSLKNFSTTAKDAANAGPSVEHNDMQFEHGIPSPYTDQERRLRNENETITPQPRSHVLQKPQRNFAEAYDHDEIAKHAGTSGPAKRVMDFFRRRGKARSGQE